jgi:hypothetical protein
LRVRLRELHDRVDGSVDRNIDREREALCGKTRGFGRQHGRRSGAERRGSHARAESDQHRRAKRHNSVDDPLVGDLGSDLVEEGDEALLTRDLRELLARRFQTGSLALPLCPVVGCVRIALNDRPVALTLVPHALNIGEVILHGEDHVRPRLPPRKQLAQGLGVAEHFERNGA